MGNVVQIGFSRYASVTKELLDSIKVGDLVKINSWSKPLQVKGVSDNYFVMAQGDEYSIVEKKLFPYTHNGLRKGFFSASTDDRIFGFVDSKLDITDADSKQYRFDDPEWVAEYLAALEKGGDSGGINISERNGVAIERIAVKGGAAHGKAYAEDD